MVELDGGMKFLQNIFQAFLSLRFDAVLSSSTLSVMLTLGFLNSTETLTVDVEFINPLQIPLNLSSIALICKFCGGSSGAKKGK